MSILNNIQTIHHRIDSAAKKVGRNPANIKLVVAGKYADIPTLKSAIDAGVRIIGENKAQDLVKKYQAIGDRVEWHFIGHLQTNKIKYVAPIVTTIHSVDSEKLARELEKYLTKINKTLAVLIEVNTSGEVTKHGIAPEQVKHLIAVCKDLTHIKLIGLMTMSAHQHFKSLKQLADKFHLPELSMGTTRDFEIAIQEGATIVRIGSAIFK